MNIGEESLKYVASPHFKIPESLSHSHLHWMVVNSTGIGNTCIAVFMANSVPELEKRTSASESNRYCGICDH